MNAPPGLDTAKLVTVRLGGDASTTSRTLSFYDNTGDIPLFADLQGYYAP